MTFKDTVRSLFRRPRPIPRADAVEIADWVNEGGTFDPAGPPRLIEDEVDQDDKNHPKPLP